MSSCNQLIATNWGKKQSLYIPGMSTMQQGLTQSCWFQSVKNKTNLHTNHEMLNNNMQIIWVLMYKNLQSKLRNIRMPASYQSLIKMKGMQFSTKMCCIARICLLRKLGSIYCLWKMKCPTSSQFQFSYFHKPRKMLLSI